MYSLLLIVSHEPPAVSKLDFDTKGEADTAFDILDVRFNQVTRAAPNSKTILAPVKLYK